MKFFYCLLIFITLCFITLCYKTLCYKLKPVKPTFYVCSYGGCGSTYLVQSLKQYGNVEHIHSRFPPKKLEYVGVERDGSFYEEWFNGKKIPKNQLKNYYVIYIYRNPVKSIISRFHMSQHLKNIQIDENIMIEDVIKQNKDLFKINEFYDNYTKSKKRNYKIYCIKYEELFDKQDELSKVLNIGPLNLIKKESNRNETSNEIKLTKIYKNLINKMSNNDFISIV